MAQYFPLTLDTAGPTGCSITPPTKQYLKDNSNPYTLDATGASFMKVWWSSSASGSTSDANFPTSWSVYSTSWTSNFSTNGNVYVHAIFRDDVNNDSAIINSAVRVYDTGAPTVTSVVINNGADFTSNPNVKVKVVFGDTLSGVATVTLTGNITSSKTVTLTDTDRTNGYVDNVAVVLTSPYGDKTITASVTDRAGNASTTSKSDSIRYDESAEYLASPTIPDGTSALDDYVNTRPMAIKISTTNADITTGYKVWGDFNTVAGGSSTGTTEPSSYTTWSGSTALVSGLYLTTGEGTKTFHVKVKDIDGNESVVDIKSVVYDITAPVVSASLATTAPHVISLQPSFNSTTVKVSVTEAHNVPVPGGEEGGAYGWHSGIYDTLEEANAATIEDANLSHGWANWTVTQDFPITGANVGAHTSTSGIKYFKIFVRDLANNWGSAITTFIYDIDAPTKTSLNVHSVALNYYNNQTKGFVSSFDDIPSSEYSTTLTFEGWVDNAPSTTTVPSSVTAQTLTKPWGTTEADASYFYWNNVQNGTAYVHVRVTDIVGNSAIYHSSGFTYDTVAPTAPTIVLPAYSSSSSVTASLSASDATSGVYQVKLYGDIVDTNGNAINTVAKASWQTYNTSIAIKYSSGDGVKTVYAVFRDKVGNETTAVSTTGVFDGTLPNAEVHAYNAGNTTIIDNARVNTNGLSLRITGTDPNGTSPITQYKIWGDFGTTNPTTTSTPEASAQWKTYTLDSGQTYMSIKSLYLNTSANGEKTIYLKVKDASGNESTSSSTVVIYDTSVPVITVANQDYNRVSTIHQVRMNTSTAATIASTFSDMMTFSFTANEALRAFKVCVNATGQTAASASAIPTTAGSSNMSGGAKSANQRVDCTIMGADLKSVVTNDGAYEIIVYGQDTAGNWSAIHSI